MEHAAELIAAPLARLGIDAGPQALAIAHRCGCQPIVLLRFGECLLERLDQVHHVANRDRLAVRVTPIDVVEVFKGPGVEEEIWDVALGNFQGNEKGFVLFAALLLEFASRGPGAVIEEAERCVLERLRDFDPDLTWLTSRDDAHAEIAAHLRDLADRHLLVRHGDADHPAYALALPAPPADPAPQELARRGAGPSPRRPPGPQGGAGPRGCCRRRS